MAYLTTDAPTADTVCRRFRIPVRLLSNFMGALEVLTIPEIWEEFGDMTAAESAEAYRNVIDTQADNCMIGTVFPYITENAPDGSLSLDGSTYNDADFPLLSANIDPSWSNGNGTFTLPNVSGRTIIGVGAGAGLTNRAVGDIVGTEEHTLTSVEMPEHEHGYTTALLYDVPMVTPGEVDGWVGQAPADTTPSGEGGAHQNMQPSIALPMAVWFR